MIKKEKDFEFFLRETLGYSLEKLHIELIERPHILGTLWNLSEDRKSSQVRTSSCFEFHYIKVHFLVLCFKTQMLHVISHEWSTSIYIPFCVFVWDTKLYFSMCFTNNWSKSWPNCLFAKVVTFEESKGSTTPHRDDCRSQLLHIQIYRQVETFSPTSKEVEGFSMGRGVSKSFLRAENVFSPGANSLLTCSVWNFVHVFGCHRSCSEWGPNLNRVTKIPSRYQR